MTLGVTFNLYHNVCIPGVSCGPPPDRPMVLLLGMSFDYGDRVVYMCRRRLTPVSTPVLTCGIDGKWDKAPECRGGWSAVICMEFAIVPSGVNFCDNF